MRISDWSSDVCSSDLAPLQLRLGSKLPSLHILSLKRREQNLSRQRRIPEPAPHPQRLPRLRDVVDAQQLRALFRRPIMERDAAAEPRVGGRFIVERTDHPFAAGAEQDRAAEGVKARAAVDRREMFSSEER